MPQDFKVLFSLFGKKIVNKNKSRSNDMEPDLKIFRNLMIAA